MVRTITKERSRILFNLSMIVSYTFLGEDKRLGREARFVESERED
jgi:hypothetical protein